LSAWLDAGAPVIRTQEDLQQIQARTAAGEFQDREARDDQSMGFFVIGLLNNDASAFAKAQGFKDQGEFRRTRHDGNPPILG
jgi:hypothetical protein